VEQSGQGLHIRPINVVITSSRDANIRVRNFLNALEIIIPHSLKINRGRRNLKEIFALALSLHSPYVLLISTLKGNPYKMTLYDLVMLSPKYVFKIRGISLPSDFGIALNEIQRGPICILYNTCGFIKGFILDLGYPILSESKNNCKILSFFKQVDSNFCEATFMDKDNNKFLRISLELWH